MSLLLKNILFTILVPGIVAVLIPLAIAGERHLASSPVLLALGVLLLIIGTSIYGWTAWDFAIRGRGTPLPLDAPKKLITKGLYRYTRNPMYVGVMAVISGWVLVFADGWILLYALAVGIAVHLFIIYYEEPKLHELFGDLYTSYQQSVGRWLPRKARK